MWSHTLNSVPYEVEKNSLQEWNVASPHAPRVPILYREANVPLQASPCDHSRERRDQYPTDHNDQHGLADRETHRYPQLGDFQSSFLWPGLT